MRHIYTPLTLYILVLAMLMLLSSKYSMAHSPDGCVVRITGKLQDRNTGKPYKMASILVFSGERVVASKSTDKTGAFVLHIPPEKIKTKHLVIKIKYRDHIFNKTQILPVSQDILVEINGQVLLSHNPVDSFDLPIHELDNPYNGRVLIQMKNYRLSRESFTNVPEEVGL